MKKISVVLSVYNAQGTLERVLKSVKWADEIIIVNNSSTDGTRKTAAKYASGIYDRPNNPMLNVNKNFGFGKAGGDFILNLDADEEVTPELKTEILGKVNSPDPAKGYWIPRKNIIFGKWIQHGLWWPDKQLRLFKKGSGRFPEKHVHEYLEVDGRTESLINPFVHYNYESVNQFLYKLGNIYTDNEVKNMLEAGYKPVWQDAIRFPLSDFLKIYFAQKGYQDGLHGLVLSMFQSFYSFVVFVKLWEKRDFFDKDITLPEVGREFVRSRKEISYWWNGQMGENVKFPGLKLWYKFRRRFRV